MTQQSLITLDGRVLAGTQLERDARAHARKHGLTFVRVEMDRGLFGLVEVALFERDGQYLRRTAEMLAQSKQA